MSNNTPLRDQARFTDSVIWCLARIVQEILNKSTWLFSKDNHFADRILAEHRNRVREEDE